MEDINVNSIKKTVSDLLGKWSKKLNGELPVGDLKTSKLAEHEVYIVYKNKDIGLTVDQAFIARTKTQLDAIMTYADRSPVESITKARFIEKYIY